MWMKIQRVKTVIYSAALLAAASSLMSVANAAEELQT
ncbi:AfaD family invasin, partial [Yersinia enterocolitica]